MKTTVNNFKESNKQVLIILFKDYDEKKDLQSFDYLFNYIIDKIVPENMKDAYRAERYNLTTMKKLVEITRKLIA